MELVYEIEADDFYDRFEINFVDSDHAIAIKNTHASDHSWTKLEFHQCPHCPIKNLEHCPVALQLSQLQAISKQFQSFETLNVKLFKDQNILSAQVTAQQLLTSLAGLLVAGTSICTHTQFLYPMAKFHHPFASMDESVYRALANLALSFQVENSDDQFVEYVTEKYKNISTVNRHLIKRMQTDSNHYEALINGIMNLETFSQGVLFNLKSNFSELSELIAHKRL